MLLWRLTRAQALSGFQDDDRVEVAPPPKATSAAADTTFGSAKTLDTEGMAQRHSQYDHAAMAKRYPATVIVPGMLGAIVSSSRSPPQVARHINARRARALCMPRMIPRISRV
jgi:hypothetical protein